MGMTAERNTPRTRATREAQLTQPRTRRMTEENLRNALLVALEPFVKEEELLPGIKDGVIDDITECAYNHITIMCGNPERSPAPLKVKSIRKAKRQVW